MILSGVILAVTLLIFAFGKSPLFRVDRTGVAIIGGALTIATGVLTFDMAVKSIDYRTIVLLFSMMILSSNLKSSGFFRLVGNFMLNNFKTRKSLLFGVIVTSGVLSAFFINDVVCLLFTPIVIMICKRTKVSPVPYLIGIATASNIGSAGTLLGNPQNILIGSISKISFLTYFAKAFPVSLIGLLINYFMVSWLYRTDLTDPLTTELVKVQPFKEKYHRYLVGKSLLVTICILAGFVLSSEPAVIASLGAASLLVTRRLKPEKIYSGIDFNLLVMFGGLFVVMGGVEQSGLMNRIMEIINFKGFISFSLVTVILSNLFSNVPAVMLLKSFIPMNGGTIWWTGLGVFSTIAGNLTLTGSIANLIVVESANREGINIGFFEYLKTGLPLTVLLVLISVIYFKLISIAAF